MRNLYLIVSLVGLVACTKPNPNRCCLDPADCQTNNIPVGSTCKDGLVCRGNQCIAETCSTSAECESMAPYCANGLCASGCTDDTQCPGAAQDPSDKFCVASTCVVCRAGMNDCPSSAPVCDNGACRACTADSDCLSGLCNVDDGTCVDASAIVYASPAGSSSAACTKTDPCSLAHALSVASVDQTRGNVQLVPGTYTGGATVSGPATVTVFAESSTLGDQFNVQDGFTLRLRDATFADSGIVYCNPTTTGGPMPQIDLERVSWPGSNPVNAVYGSPCKINLRHVHIHAPPGNALVYANGELAGSSGATSNRGSVVEVDQTVFDGGDPAISLVNYSTLTMTNSILMNQGSTETAIGVDNQFPGTSSVSFTTFYNTTWKCLNGTPYMQSSNNIFLNQRAGAPADTVGGTGCSHNYDMIEPQADAPTGTNNLLGIDPMFVNAAMQDFHLMPASPAIDAADPAATSPDHDYDGTPRPQGARRDIGAFEYKP